MRIFFFHITFILLSVLWYSPAMAQGLTGKWLWENDQMQADVYFSDDMYYLEAFIKNSNAQISEGFSYYMVRGDTLIFNKVPVSEGREPLAYHYIESISDLNMVLVDMRNGKKDRYTRVDHEYHFLTKYRNDEFYYAGGTNVCVSDIASENYHPCLNFGDISVNSSIEEIELILGEPYDIMRHGDNLYRVYLLEALEDGSQPYFALELQNDNIKSIQITGIETREHLSFSSISLGDYHTFVEQKLGKPSEIGEIDDETIYWDYAPFSFSFEIKNDFVYSIKLMKK